KSTLSMILLPGSVTDARATGAASAKHRPTHSIVASLRAGIFGSSAVASQKKAGYVAAKRKAGSEAGGCQLTQCTWQEGRRANQKSGSLREESRAAPLPRGAKRRAVGQRLLSLLLLAAAGHQNLGNLAALFSDAGVDTLFTDLGEGLRLEAV